MASPSKHQLTVLLYGKLYLPALSLALLTGFTFSMSLSSSLQALLPAMESLFLVSLPHLWQASLSWVTPPCLFLILNGIIMILTATSGSLSRSAPSPSSELPSAKMEKFTCTDVVASIQDADDVVASTEPVSVSASASIGNAPPHLLVLQTEGAIVPFTDNLHAHYAIMEDLDHGDDKKEMQIVSQEAFQLRINDTIVVDRHDDIVVVDRHEIDSLDDPSSPSCEEVPKGGSEPSTPKYSSSSAAMKDNMRRSLSIDSALCFDDIEASPENNLSEEAFKKRIEDYIFKVNAKLRSETRLL